MMRLEPTDMEIDSGNVAIDCYRLRWVLQDLNKVAKSCALKKSDDGSIDEFARGFNAGLEAFVEELKERFGVLFK